MHIPDGYLSPTTSIVMYAASAPFLAVASRQVQKKLNRKSIPMLGVFGAFSFLIMMLNVPLPGGTTGHAVGSVLAAIVLGPWLSILSTTIALIIQALFFGDGGILTLGANIFNMAIVMSLVGYGVFMFLKKVLPKKNLEPFFAGIAGYIGINVAACLAGIELGLQSLLFKSSTGQPLYFPYPLRISVPAMMLGHLTIAGLAEFFITTFAYVWIVRQAPQLLQDEVQSKKTISLRPMLIAISAFIFLVPLGLLAPGTAWGEWGRVELKSLGLGYIPQGFDRWNNLWHAPIPGYNVLALHNPAIAYIISALLGVALIIGVVMVASLLWHRLSKKI